MDIYILDKMLNGLGNVSALAVTSIILAHMRYSDHLISLKNTKHHCPFAIAILRILVACGVDFTGETSLSPAPTHALTAAAMTGMYFICRRGVWYKNPNSQNLYSHVRDPPILALPGRSETEKRECMRKSLWIKPVAHMVRPRRAAGPREVHEESILLYLIAWMILSNRMARLEPHATSHAYSSDINALQYDRSALNNQEESK